MDSEAYRRVQTSGPWTTRRAFISAIVGAHLQCTRNRMNGETTERRADITLRIGRTQLEVAPGHTVTTTTYNGAAPGPLVRMKEGATVTVDIRNDTDVPEYVHWHGFEVSPELDGTQEERSLAVAAGGRLQYELTAVKSGSRYVHSHAMAMTDLSRGVYSGQFAFVYVEPKVNPGSYDQEIFLSTHEWEPRLVPEQEDESAEEEEDDGEWDGGSMEIKYGIRSINGKALGHGEPICVKEGERVLFHFLNASATENIQLYLPGHKFYVIALDGNPAPRPAYVSVLELGVGERVDALVEMNNPGVWILGSVADDIRQSGLGIRLEYAFRQGDPQYAAAGDLPWDYLRFGRAEESPKPDEVIPMHILRIPPDGHGMERWTINGHAYSDQDPPKVLTCGRRYRLAFNNRTAEAHPVHLHRYTFELVRIGANVTSGVMKDVILLQPYQTADVDFIPRQPGLALLHCHQQMHMEMGFKRLFRIV